MKSRSILLAVLITAALTGCASHPDAPARMVRTVAPRRTAQPVQPLDTYLAEGQDLAGTAAQRPACGQGCPLNSLGTVVLYNMKWPTWDATKATGTGSETIQSCGATLCSGMPQYSAKVRVTFSKPVKDCQADQAYWTRAVFSYPEGLGDAPAPPDPWNFTTLAQQARQTCAG
jgi:hypothetical protein